jgi:hypothetical protein
LIGGQALVAGLLLDLVAGLLLGRLQKLNAATLMNLCAPPTPLAQSKIVHGIIQLQSRAQRIGPFVVNATGEILIKSWNSQHAFHFSFCRFSQEGLNPIANGFHGDTTAGKTPFVKSRH